MALKLSAVGRSATINLFNTCPYWLWQYKPRHSINYKQNDVQDLNVSSHQRRHFHHFSRQLCLNHKRTQPLNARDNAYCCDNVGLRIPQLKRQFDPLARQHRFSHHDTLGEISASDKQIKDADSMTSERTHYEYESEDRLQQNMSPEYFYQKLAPDESDPSHIQMQNDISEILHTYEMLLYSSGQVPSTLSVKDMENLLENLHREGWRSTNNYFRYLYQKEAVVAPKKLAMKIERRKNFEKTWNKWEDRRGKDPNWLPENLWDAEGRPIYALWHNNMFFRFNPKCVKRGASASRLRRAAQFGQPFIVDLGFESYMKKEEIRKAAHQIEKIYGCNRADNKDPFDLWFVNYRPNSLLASELERFMPGLSSNPTYLIRKFEEHYVDLDFPKSKLVYLTSHGTKELYHFDPESIYIIGGYWSNQQDTSLIAERAIRDGIKMAKLPLDRYLRWKRIPKTLCPNHMFAVMSDLKNGKPMRETLFDRVPPTKIMTSDEIEAEFHRKLTSGLRSRQRWNVKGLLNME